MASPISCNPNGTVYSRDLKWEPVGSQIYGNKIEPVYDDILIAKLRPGQVNPHFFTLKIRKLRPHYMLTKELGKTTPNSRPSPQHIIGCSLSLL